MSVNVARALAGLPPVLGPLTKEQAALRAYFEPLVRAILARPLPLPTDAFDETEVRIDVKGACLSPWPIKVKQLPMQTTLLEPDPGDPEADYSDFESPRWDDLWTFRGKTRTRHIPLKRSWQVRERDGHRCVKCGRNASDGVKLHIDHIVPFSLGGTNDLTNLQTLCDECNLGKGADMEHS